MKWASIAFELVSFIVFFLCLGFVIDKIWLKTGVAPAIGVITGFFLWVFYLWKRLR